MSQKLPLFIQDPMPGLPGSVKSATNDTTHTAGRRMESILLESEPDRKEVKISFLKTDLS
jgi:hypothetical protein